MKYKPPSPAIKTRSALPITAPTKRGIELRCPFCVDHHVLYPDRESPCGTRIEVTATQEIFTSHTTKHEHLTCAKCAKTGGEMVRFGNAFVHLANCTPGKVLVQEPPKNSLVARLVYGMPKSIRVTIEKYTGRADIVQEVDEKGEVTGVILSYFFWSKPNGRKPTQSKQVPA